jgi:hypothetical protein
MIKIEDKIIDSVLLKAFDLYKIDNDIPSDYQLCSELDIMRATMSRWRKGVSKTIKYDLWKVLSPKIQHYINEAEKELGLETLGQEHGPRLTFEFHVKMKVFNESQKIRLGNLYDSLTANLEDVVEAVEPQEEKPEPIKFEVAEQALPYIRQKISAGNGCEILEERYQKRPDMHFMDVSGVSMAPTYKDGQKVICQLFQERVVFGDDFLPMEIIKNMIPEDSVIIYELNGGGLSMKRAKYKKTNKAWSFILDADNEKWGNENNFPRFIRKGDDFIIYGKIVGASK